MQINPFLPSLQTFIVVAEQLSFSRASDLLHLTPSAISHQMKLLEQNLGIKLFVRKSKGVALTPDAEQLYTHVKKGLQLVNSGVSKLQQHTNKKLVIAAIPSAIDLVLMPRLNAINALFDGYQIQFVSAHQIVDFENSDVDCHLHFGDGQYSASVVKKICDEKVYPVCHPDQVVKSEDLDLIDYQAGFEDQPGCFNWNQWQRYFEQESKPVKWSVDQVSFALLAAEQKQGMTLGWHQLSKDKIKSEQLVRVGNKEILQPYSYYFVSKYSFTQKPELAKLFTWLCSVFNDID